MGDCRRLRSLAAREAGENPALSRNCNGVHAGARTLASHDVCSHRALWGQHGRGQLAPSPKAGLFFAHSEPNAPLLADPPWCGSFRSQRGNRRMKHVRSRVTIVIATLSLLFMIAGTASAQEASPVAEASGLEGAVSWLLTQQADDGGFLGFTGESDAGFTLDAIMALVAAEHQGVDSGDAVQRAVDYLGTDDIALVYAQTGVGQSAKLILGLVAAGVEPEGFANVMPLSIIEKGQNSESGLYGTGLYDHAYALLALAVLGEEIPETAFIALGNTQAENGGWAWDGSIDLTSTDSNTTSMVIQALVATGHADDDITSNGFTYLTSLVTSEGGLYNDAEGTEADANSTALIMQAYLAVGEETGGLDASLLTFQNPSGGLFYQASDTTDNSFATVQAIPPLAGLAFPIVPAAAPTATPVAFHVLAAA